MTDDPIERHREAWAAAHARIVAAAAANDMAALAEAVDALAAVRASVGVATGDPEALEYAFHELEDAGFPGACPIATDLLARGEVVLARKVLAPFPAASTEHLVLSALEAGDSELALVRQGELPETGLTPTLPVHWALIREVGAAVARAFSGTKEQILIGLSAFTNATYGEYDELVDGNARAEAWMKSLLLSDDPDVRAYAIARMCSRRSTGEHNAHFVSFGRRYARLAYGMKDTEKVIAALFENAYGAAPAPNGIPIPMLGTTGASVAIAGFEVDSGYLGLLEPGSEPFGYAQFAVNGAMPGKWRAERLATSDGLSFVVASHTSHPRAPNEARWLKRSGLVDARSGRLAIVDRLHRVEDALRLGKGAQLDVPRGFWPQCFVSYADSTIVGVGVSFVAAKPNE